MGEAKREEAVDFLANALVDELDLADDMDDTAMTGRGRHRAARCMSRSPLAPTRYGLRATRVGEAPPPDLCDAVLGLDGPLHLHKFAYVR